MVGLRRQLLDRGFGHRSQPIEGRLDGRRICEIELVELGQRGVATVLVEQPGIAALHRIRCDRRTIAGREDFHQHGVVGVGERLAKDRRNIVGHEFPAHAPLSSHDRIDLAKAVNLAEYPCTNSHDGTGRFFVFLRVRVSRGAKRRLSCDCDEVGSAIRSDVDHQRRRRSHDQRSIDSQRIDGPNPPRRDCAHEGRHEGRGNRPAALQRAAEESVVANRGKAAINGDRAAELGDVDQRGQAGVCGNVEPRSAPYGEPVDGDVAAQRGGARVGQRHIEIARVDIDRSIRAYDRIDVVGDEIGRPGQAVVERRIGQRIVREFGAAAIACMRVFLGEFGSAVLCFIGIDQPVARQRAAATRSFGRGLGFPAAQRIQHVAIGFTNPRIDRTVGGACRRGGIAGGQVFAAIARVVAFGIEADFAELRRIAGDAVPRRGRQAVHHIAVLIDNTVDGIEGGDPVIGIFPIAVPFNRRDIAIGVGGDDIIPEQVERLVEAFGAVAREDLRAEEARTTRQHRDDEVFVAQRVVRGIEDQRATRVAACGRAFAFARFILVEVEVERIGLVGIVEVEPVEDLRQIAEGRAEQESVAVVERGQRAEHVFGRFAAPVDAEIVARGSRAGAAVAGDVDVIASAIGVVDFLGRRQGREQQRPGRQVGCWRVEAGEGDITF